MGVEKSNLSVISHFFMHRSAMKDHYDLCTRDTANINHSSNLRKAIETLKGDPSPAEKRESIAQIEVSLHIMEHKVLRIKELEAEVSRLKTAQPSVIVEQSTSDLVHALAELQENYDRACETIRMLKALLETDIPTELIETGT